MATISVKRTTDLSQFELHEQNRLVVKDGTFIARKDLLDSMRRYGYRPSQPISVTKAPNGKLCIFDGHNRFITAKSLGIEVFYQEFAKEHAVTPLEYSRGQKQWTMHDIADAVALNNADYSEVTAYAKETGIPVTAAFSMFAGESAGSGNMHAKVKNGVFTIRDRQKPAQVAQIVTALKKVCDFANTQNLVNAISKCLFVDAFHVPKMIERIERNPELLKKCRTTEDYIDLLEIIYNRNTKIERLYLREEVRKAMSVRTKILRKS